MKHLITRCFFRADGVYCHEGYLYYTQPDFKHTNETRVMVEGEPVTCSICDGKGHILTPDGRELLIFLEVCARPMLRDLVDELFEEREQR
jgi:hypothetical protein